jgi:hypothetical protein
MQDIRNRLGSKEDSSKRKQPSQLAKTQEESVRIEDSSGQQSSEKRED